MVDKKGNTPLPCFSKGESSVKLLLTQNETDTKVINRSHESALDTAEKMAQSDVTKILQEYGVQSAKTLSLKQIIQQRTEADSGDIKHEVPRPIRTHSSNRGPFHSSGQYADDLRMSHLDIHLGGSKHCFKTSVSDILFLCDGVSSILRRLSFVVVGKEERWMAIGVTIIGTTIMATTLGTMLYWVIMHRMESSKNKRNYLRKNSDGSMSKSIQYSVYSDAEVLENDFKKMYAI
ncbi:hypothetical protein Leryth_018430 [Lithospermum erythrorhizon]|nr:hypothetical protein Leryth_018430 [Lithospermum erythrorhizon]